MTSFEQKNSQSPSEITQLDSRITLKDTKEDSYDYIIRCYLKQLFNELAGRSEDITKGISKFIFREVID